MTDKEVEMLAVHLGHDVKTHKENYRLAHSTRELTSVARLLLTVEKGNVNHWRGKSLREVNAQDKKLIEKAGIEDEDNSFEPESGDGDDDDDIDYVELNVDEVNENQVEDSLKASAIRIDSDSEEDFPVARHAYSIRMESDSEKDFPVDTDSEEDFPVARHVVRSGMKRRWSEEENNVLKKFFKYELDKKQMPLGEKLKKGQKLLKGRTVAQIRTKVNNEWLEKENNKTGEKIGWTRQSYPDGSFITSSSKSSVRSPSAFFIVFLIVFNLLLRSQP